MAKISPFRLSDAHLALLDDLAASRGGVRSDALRDAITYWHRAVREAGAANAADLSSEDWNRLAHLNDPGPMEGLGDEDEGPLAIDWSARLAHELVGMWEGRAVVLPEHAAERVACRNLAKRIARWGAVRGYALWAALSYFWKTPSAGVGGGDWWHPATWMTPTAKEA